MKVPVFILTLLCPLAVIAQPGNLVPNPSFEDLIECPDYYGQVSRAEHWFQAVENLTPDIFNSCSNCCTVSVPFHFFSYQHPRTGNGYSGLYNYILGILDNIGGYREYIGVELLDSLIAGKTYHWCMYVSLMDKVTHACNNIGVALSQEKYDLNPNWNIFFTNFANLTSNNSSIDVVNDSINWIKIEGTLVAQGGEKYLYIGNFYPNNQTTCQYVGTGNMLWGNGIDYSYYYIDDVYFGEFACSDSLNDSIPNFETEPTFFWPNIFTPNSDGINDQFGITFNGYINVEYTIFNRWGTVVYSGKNNQVWDGNINGYPASDGVYFLFVTAIEQLNGSTIRKTGTLQLVR